MSTYVESRLMGHTLFYCFIDWKISMFIIPPTEKLSILSLNQLIFFRNLTQYFLAYF